MAVLTGMIFFASLRLQPVWLTENTRAVQVVASFRDSAQAVLGDMEKQQRCSYVDTVLALDRRFGHSHEAEAFKAKLQYRVQKEDELLRELAQSI